MVQGAVRSAGYLPAHDYFGQILDSDGTVLLCLHKWGAHEHPSLMSPDHGTPGNGLLLFFRVDDFDLALQRARSLVSRLDEEQTSIRTLEQRSSRSEIRTDITLRSVRSLGAKKRSQLLKLAGVPRGTRTPLGSVSRSFEDSDRITAQPGH